METSIKNSILKMLRTEYSTGWWVKIHDLFTSGIPDILGCYKGRFVAIEVKSKKGKASKLQEYILEKIRQAGGIAGEARSREDLREIFKGGEKNEW